MPIGPTCTPDFDGQIDGQPTSIIVARTVLAIIVMVLASIVIVLATIVLAANIVVASTS